MFPGFRKSKGTRNQIANICWIIEKARGLHYNVALVSAVQQSESVIHIHMSPLFWISFPFGLPQRTESCSLCCAVGSHQLPTLYIVVYICQSQSPNSSHPPSHRGIHKCVLYICISIFAFQIHSSVPFF